MTGGSRDAMSPAAPPDVSAAPEWAFGVCAGVHASGCRDVVYVPDNPLSHVLRVFGAQYPDVRLMLATREEEAFGIAAGLYLGGRRPAVLLQSSGLGNSLNALTSLLAPYRIPVLMVVSMRGDEGEWNSAQMPMGRAVRAILKSIGIRHATVDSGETSSETVRRAGMEAFAARVSHACLLPKLLTAQPGPTGPTSVPDAADLRPRRSQPPSPGPPTSVPEAADLRPQRSQPPSPGGPTSVPEAADLRPRLSPRLSRLDATQIVVAHAGEAAIIASLGHPAYDLFAAGDRPRNFYTWGSMGLASSIGLGLALARADVHVFVLDGDGSLLMNLGSLATIGLLHPSNFTLIVMDNEQYATTGGQDTPTALGADLEAAARAMRIASTFTVHTPDALADAIAAAETTGPTVIVAKVAESAPTVKPPLDCVALKERFMAAIGADPS